MQKGVLWELNSISPSDMIFSINKNNEAGKKKLHGL
jgi:hypothetical protein